MICGACKGSGFIIKRVDKRNMNPKDPWDIKWNDGLRYRITICPKCKGVGHDEMQKMWKDILIIWESKTTSEAVMSGLL